MYLSIIVEHPFGTIKRSWRAYYFLTKGKLSVTAEVVLTFLAYNMKRVINILGNAEKIKRKKGSSNSIKCRIGLFFNYFKKLGFMAG